MDLFTHDELAAFIHADPDSVDATAVRLARDGATAYLESELGVKLARSTDADITYVVRWNECWIVLPTPVISVSAVSVDGTALGATDYTLVNHRLYRGVGWGGSRWGSQGRFDVYLDSSDEFTEVAVTLTYGFAVPPNDLKDAGLFLAAQKYLLAPKIGLQASRLDDYSETYATGGGGPSATAGLPSEVLGPLKARYGRGVDVVTPL